MVCHGPDKVLRTTSDLRPRTAVVRLRVRAGVALEGGTVSVDAGAAVREITRVDNAVELR